MAARKFGEPLPAVTPAAAVTMIEEAAAAVVHPNESTQPARVGPGPHRGGIGPARTNYTESMMKTAEEMMSFGQANFEALVKAGQIWAVGVQDLGKHVAATAQAQMDHTMSGWKALASVKSVREAMTLQTSLVRSSLEQVMTETGKFTDASMKLAEQAIAPIAARMTIAAETVAAGA